MILIKGGRVFVEGEFRELDVLIEGQKIKAIGKDLITDSRTRVIDARGKLVTPGFIDVHVHLRGTRLYP